MTNESKKQLSKQSVPDKKPRAGGRSKSFGDMQFINVSLSEAQKSACSKWIDSGVELDETLDGILSAEYKLSLGFDERNGAFMATLTDRREDSKFYAHCYTLRARTPLLAVLRVCWLHAVFANGNWDEFATPDASSDVW